MGNKIYATQFGEFLMPFNDGGGYTIVIVDIPKNLVTRAILTISKDTKEVPTYAPRFDSYNECVMWLAEHFEDLF